jgi:hypothetical protein
MKFSNIARLSASSRSNVHSRSIRSFSSLDDSPFWFCTVEVARDLSLTF